MALSDKQFYTILSKNGELALDAGASQDNGSLVRLQTPDGSDSQLWQVLLVEDTKFFKLKNKSSGKLLDTLVSGIEAGTWCQQWDDVDGDSQIWYAEEAEEGYTKLKSQKSGRCLDIVAMAAVEGALLQIWDDVDGENQQWKMTAAVQEQAPAKAPRTKKPAAKEPAQKKPAAKTATKKAAAPKSSTQKASSAAEVSEVVSEPAKAEKPAAPAKKPAAKRSRKK